MRGPAEVEFSPFRVSDWLVVGSLDSLNLAVSATPVESSSLVGKSHELISTTWVTQERSNVVSLDVRLFLPARWELALANGEVGVLFDIAKSVNVQRVGLSESHSLESENGIVGLMIVGVGQEEESICQYEAV